MKRTVLVGFFAAGWMILSADAAFASRAELDGRGLPRFLADDPTILSVFPGGAGDVPSQMLIDFVYGSYDPYYEAYENPEPFEPREANTRFAVALFGRSVKFGYLLDGSTHNIVLGMPRGFGFTLGFADRYDESESFRRSEYSDHIEERYEYRKTSETQIRASLGWKGRLGERRTLSLAAAGSYLESNIQRDFKSTLDGVVREETHGMVESDPGVGWEVALQSLDPVSGLLIAARYSDKDRHPQSEEVTATAWRSQRASLDLGWRWTPQMLDDLVFGCTGSWSKDESDFVLGSPSYDLYASETEFWRGGFFISGERRVVGLVYILQPDRCRYFGLLFCNEAMQPFKIFVLIVR